MNAIEVSKRLSSGPVFLKMEFEGVVLRSVPGNPVTFFARFSGEKEKEWPIGHTTETVNNALLEWNEITHKEYKEF